MDKGEDATWRLPQQSKVIKGDRSEPTRDRDHSMRLVGHILLKRGSLLTIVLAFAFCSACVHSTRRKDLPSGLAYDKALLIWLVQYHQDQDRMITPCSQNETIRPELRTFCSEVDRQHAERLQRMRSWLQQWYQTDLPRPDPFPLWLGSLKGQQFEKEFFKEYLDLHNEGIAQTRKCETKAQHSELRELCARINPLQQRTSEQLKMWRCEWFKACR